MIEPKRGFSTVKCAIMLQRLASFMDFWNIVVRQAWPDRKFLYKVVYCRLGCFKFGGFCAMDVASQGTDLALQDIRLATVEGGEAGVLIMRSNQLLAVLSQVDEDVYAPQGGWVLEVGFGRLSGCHKIFRSVEEALSWIRSRSSSVALSQQANKHLITD